MPTDLSVNIDHIATVRQARGVDYPDPVRGAEIAEDAGASGITVHLRSDRRHIQDDDVRRLARSVRGKLNLEMAATEEMLRVALDTAPGQVTLVPERPEEITTEGGLDLVRRSGQIRPIVEGLAAAGISVSAFVDPQPEQIAALAELPRGAVRGFEINTDRYTKARDERAAGEELDAIRRAVAAGRELGFEIYAGHGLTTGNVGPIAAIEEVVEVNIGHSIVASAVLTGLDRAVRDMLGALAAP